MGSLDAGLWRYSEDRRPVFRASSTMLSALALIFFLATTTAVLGEGQKADDASAESSVADHGADQNGADQDGADQDGADQDGEVKEEYSNKLKWSTASEVDNFGFDIFRSESEDGPFERINPEPIPGHGTTDEPTLYEYVDDTIDPTKAYFYYIESISFANEREKFTPTFRAPPKAPLESESEDSSEEGEKEG